jgi:transposase
MSTLGKIFLSKTYRIQIQIKAFLLILPYVRRKFDDAEKTTIGGKASTQRQSATTKAKELIAKLYVLDKDSRDLSDDERLSIRQKLSKPLVDEFFEYLHSMLSKVPPKSPLGKAMNYAASNQYLLIRVLENSCLPLDNNAAENAIRPFAVGRKSWLFSDTVKGADASANIYSVIESAKLAGHEPYFYLRMLMEELPKARTLADLEALLPHNVKPLDRVLH